jgi:hypothetical protein
MSFGTCARSYALLHTDAKGSGSRGILAASIEGRSTAQTVDSIVTEAKVFIYRRLRVVRGPPLRPK